MNKLLDDLLDATNTNDPERIVEGVEDAIYAVERAADSASFFVNSLDSAAESLNALCDVLENRLSSFRAAEEMGEPLLGDEDTDELGLNASTLEELVVSFQEAVEDLVADLRAEFRGLDEVFH